MSKIKLQLYPKAHNIFCIGLERVKRIEAFLDEITGETSLFGKRTDNYWLINTEVNFNPSNDENLYFFGELLNQCRVRNYHTLMVIK